jgi:PLP dependent protein
LPVTKTVDADRLLRAAALGLTRFGENRVQEAEMKASVLPNVTWELIGGLQSNKARRAVGLFSAIHSIDSLELAERVSRVAAEIGRARYPVYLEVNVDADPAKGGFALDGFPALAARIAALGGLNVAGLMTVGRLVSDAHAARPTFSALRDLSNRLRSDIPGFGAGLSMGMSDDFEVAVEEGATVVRLGRALFGERPTA